MTNVTTPSSRRRREIQKIVEEFCSDYSIETTRGTHVKITLRRGPHSRYVVTSGSPSCYRANLNLRSTIRKVHASLKELADAKSP